MKVFSFDPIADSQTEILILGTMPGKRSLATKQYYAHGGNSFWRLMFDLFGQPFDWGFEVRKRLLLNNHIALWDVLKACVRESSADSDIILEEPNDLKGFIDSHSNMHTICFNGNKAAEYYQRNLVDNHVLTMTLPSTSPANTHLSYNDKLEKWGAILRQNSNV